jgi:general secretion pathway protein G
MRSGNFTKLSISQNSYHSKGFTLVELLVVLTILALLLSLATPRYFNSIEKAKDAALKEELNTVRESLDKFYGDRGQYPKSLEDLVEHKYIRKLPIDPITDKNNTWIFTPPDSPIEGDIYDIHSGAKGIAKDGTRYEDW